MTSFANKNINATMVVIAMRSGPVNNARKSR
jgi:hypothetical protein